MADDYFKAMEQIEQQLTLSVDDLTRQTDAVKMMQLFDNLLNSPLNPSQFEITSELQKSLAVLLEKPIPIQTAPCLTIDSF